MSPSDSAPLRIRVTNLDSVHQAQTWRRHGPQEAIDRTVSMFRSALLLSEQIIVDRNQLLDGVVLLALGPEGLRWHLGLPQHAPLPLVVTGSAPPGSPSIDVAEQLAAVTSPTFTSAARAALTREAAPDSPWEWLLPPMTDPAATRLPARHASTPAGRSIDDDLQEARVAWAHAMTRGEVTTAPWTQISQVPAPASGDRVLEQHPVLTALIDLDEVPTRRGQVLKILAAQRAAHPPRRDALPPVDPRGAAPPGDPLRGRDRRQHAPDLPVRVPAAAAHLPARFLTSPGAGRAGAVAVCRRARDGERETLLVRVRRPVVGRELWELPRGAGTAR